MQISKTACLTLGLLGAGVLAGSAGMAQAQEFPTKPIRFLVPFTAGGGTDKVTRVVAQKLMEAWGSTTVVENRPGAGGIVASQAVLQSDPDGHTLAVITPTQIINPSFYPNLPFDPIKDFVPITLMTRLQLILVSSPSFVPKNLKEIIELARAKPGQINFASTGLGGSAHLSMELLKQRTGIEMTHVPYKGSAPAYTDLISSRVDLLVNNIISTMPLVNSGKLKAIAVMGASRSPVAPDVPTIAESGLPGFDVSSWFGVVAPAKTPPAVVEKLNRGMVRILKDPDVRKSLLQEGAEPVGNTSDEFRQMMITEMKQWADVIKTAGIKLDGNQP